MLERLLRAFKKFPLIESAEFVLVNHTVTTPLLYHAVLRLVQEASLTAAAGGITQLVDN